MCENEILGKLDRVTRNDVRVNLLIKREINLAFVALLLRIELKTYRIVDVRMVFIRRHDT